MRYEGNLVADSLLNICLQSRFKKNSDRLLINTFKRNKLIFHVIPESVYHLFFMNQEA
jgi:hypothetical protein